MKKILLIAMFTSFLFAGCEQSLQEKRTPPSELTADDAISMLVADTLITNRNGFVVRQGDLQFVVSEYIIMDKCIAFVADGESAVMCGSFLITKNRK